MLVILRKDYGQLGNRLHTHANILAWCIEHNLALINLSFSKEAQYFSKYNDQLVKQLIQNRGFLKYFINLCKMDSFLRKLTLSDKWLLRMKKFIYIVERNDNQTLHEIDLNQILKRENKKVIIIRAWDIRCSQLLNKHAKKIREIFQPNHKILLDIENYIKALPKHDYLVGIHARQGDYKFWENGKYFFSWKNYFDWMIILEKRLRLKNKSPLFIICSDSNPPKMIESYHNCFCPNQNAITELYLLANCDLNVGPPSSYGTWAQFYKNNKRICLKSKDVNIEDYL